MNIEKIDIERLGQVVVEYRNDAPFAIAYEPSEASHTLAEKMNEIIDYLNHIA